MTNQRTATKAAIKRASAEARKAVGKLDRQMVIELTQIYRQARDDLTQTILAYGDATGSLRLESMRDLLNGVNQQLEHLSILRNTLLDDQLGYSAAIAIRPFNGVLAATALTQVAHNAVEFAHRFIAEDGLQLSDRLWRIDNHAKESIGRSIQSAIIQGHSASQAAQEFMARGETVPNDINRKIGNANAASIAKQSASTLMTGEGNPYANALRLFRTEINRAHGEAHMASGEAVEGFGGWRFLLSPNHPKVDICDMHARANVYGLGPGVYPNRERCPWPAHPGTISFTEIVFDDEITQEDRAGKEDRISWLKRQPPSVQAGALNGTMKRGALNYGLLKNNEITTPWKVLKRRYEGRGIPIDQLKGSPTSAPPNRLTPTGPPVSRGLHATANKRITQRVLELIDNVHGDGKLPLIPVKNTNSKQYNGAYTHLAYSGKPVDIKFNGRGEHPELTLAHEIGHFIDHQGIEAGKYGSQESTLFQGWVDAVQNSSPVKTLTAMREGPDRNSYNQSHIEYLLRPREIWARSYAQYITERSEDPILIEQLTAILNTNKGARSPYPYQWPKSEFEPIAQSIDQLFLKLGWLNEQ